MPTGMTSLSASLTRTESPRSRDIPRSVTVPGRAANAMKWAASLAETRLAADAAGSPRLARHSGRGWTTPTRTKSFAKRWPSRDRRRHLKMYVSVQTGGRRDKYVGARRDTPHVSRTACHYPDAAIATTTTTSTTITGVKGTDRPSPTTTGTTRRRRLRRTEFAPCRGYDSLALYSACDSRTPKLIAPLDGVHGRGHPEPASCFARRRRGSRRRGRAAARAPEATRKHPRMEHRRHRRSRFLARVHGRERVQQRAPRARCIGPSRRRARGSLRCRSRPGRRRVETEVPTARQSDASDRTAAHLETRSMTRRLS